MSKKVPTLYASLQSHFTDRGTIKHSRNVNVNIEMNNVGEWGNGLLKDFETAIIVS